MAYYVTCHPGQRVVTASFGSCTTWRNARVASRVAARAHVAPAPMEKLMNKQELIDAVAATTGDSKAATEAAVNAFVETVTRTVTTGETVQLIGFGAFSTGARAARTGRNPQTGAEIQIAAAKTVKFTPGKAFKEAVNGK